MLELYKNAAATVPSAGTDRVRLFVDTDGLPYVKDQAGTVAALKGATGATGAAGAAGATGPAGPAGPAGTAGTGCSAWVNFNGTGTVAIRNQLNVSSITDNGVGTYTVNFTSNLPDANYATIASANPQSGAAYNYAVGNPEAVPPTVSGVRVVAERSDGAAADLLNFSVAVFS